MKSAQFYLTMLFVAISNLNHTMDTSKSDIKTIFFNHLLQAEENPGTFVPVPSHITIGTREIPTTVQSVTNIIAKIGYAQIGKIPSEIVDAHERNRTYKMHVTENESGQVCIVSFTKKQFLKYLEKNRPADAPTQTAIIDQYGSVVLTEDRK